MGPKGSCQDITALAYPYCCSMVDGKIHLKRNHGYYHQVQLQLYVAQIIVSSVTFVFTQQKMWQWNRFIQIKNGYRLFVPNLMNITLITFFLK